MSGKWTKDWSYTAKLSGSENHKGFYIGIKGVGVFADVMPIDEDGKEGQKIARLMTAAPDLYDALDSILPYAANMLEHDHPVVAKARAALAKANGGDS